MNDRETRADLVPLPPATGKGRTRSFSAEFVVPVSSKLYPRVKFALTLIASGCARHQVVAQLVGKFTVTRTERATGRAVEVPISVQQARKVVDLAYEQLSIDQPPPVISAERERYLAGLDLLLQQAIAKGNLAQARLIMRDRALCAGVIKSEPGDQLDRGPAAAASLNFDNLSTAEAWALQDLLVRAADRPGRGNSDGGPGRDPEA